MRPLYIDGCEGLRVEWLAPALQVCVPDQAEQWFPLQRVSRVVVCGKAEWQTEALLACAEAGICVTFLDDEGVVIARWLGKSGERDLFLQRLADVLDRADGRDCYDNWLRAMRRQAVLSSAKKLYNHSYIDISEADLRAFFLAQQAAISVQAFDGVQRCVRGLLLAKIVALFHDLGLSADSAFLQDPWLDLPNDFTNLILWDFQVPLLHWLESLSHPADFKACVVFFNLRSERVHFLFEGLVRKLQRCLLAYF